MQFYFVFGHVETSRFFDAAYEEGIIHSFMELDPDLYGDNLPHCYRTFMLLYPHRDDRETVYEFCKSSDQNSIPVAAIYDLAEHALEIEN